MFTQLGIDEIIEKYKSDANVLNWVKSYYKDFLGNRSDAAGYFAYLCENFDLVALNRKESLQNFIDIKDQTIDEILPIVLKIVNNLIKDQHEENAFYEQLWNQISNNALFNNEEEKICAIVCCILSPAIPYRKLPQYERIEQEKVKRIAKCIEEKLKLFKYGVNSRYEKYSQISQFSLDLMKTLKDDDERIVFLALTYKYMQKQSKTT